MERLTERPASDPQVLECCHRAHHEMLFCTKASLERAVRLLQQGLDTLGEQPLLYVGLAQVHYWALESHLEPREEALGKAAEFTRHLESVHRPYTHALLAKHERFAGSQQTAIRHYEDALAVDPGDVDSLWYLAWSYGLHAGRASAGLAAADRLVSIDPLTVANLLPRAASFWGNSDFARALAVLDDMLRREPDLQWVHGFRMQMLAKLGRVSDACRLGEEIVAGNALDVNVPIVTALGHALLGRRDDLLATVTGEFESFCWDDPEAPEWLAGWFALVGETDRAILWLGHWVDRGSINYPMLAHGDPLLERLRGDPRFQRLLDRVRPEWESFVPRFQPDA